MKVNTFRIYKGVWGASPPEAEEIFKKIKQNGGFSLFFFFCFLARLPISPKLLACSLAPLKQLPVLPSSLKINNHSPQIPKTPGGPNSICY